MPQFKKMALPATQDASPIAEVPNDSTAVTAATAPSTGDTAQSGSAREVAPKTPSKISQVVAHLGRKRGTLLTDIVATTGWQSHTIRAALTGLKKNGHAIESRRDDKQTTYFLA